MNRSEGEQKVELKAGRELDALVAEKVMGSSCMESDGKEKDGHPFFCSIHNPKPFSTDISAAWEVIEEFDRVEIEYGMRDMRMDYIVTINNQFKMSESAPLAICLAALKAVGYEP